MFPRNISTELNKMGHYFLDAQYKYKGIRNILAILINLIWILWTRIRIRNADKKEYSSMGECIRKIEYSTVFSLELKYSRCGNKCIAAVH